MSENLASEIVKRLTEQEKRLIKKIEFGSFSGIDDIMEILCVQRNTALKFVNGLYKCCIINFKIDDNNKKLYTLTKFGESIAKNI